MEWRRGPIIGRGSTATVSLATVVSSGEVIAVKSTELSRSMLLQREQSLLSAVNCPYVVKYMGFNVTEEDSNKLPTYNLCMEYAPGGSLYDVIHRHGGRLNEQMISFYTCQILRGLNYLHMNGLVHCDIKSQNVLIGKDGAKVADLGCAKFVEKVDDNAAFATSEFSGTPLFMAPEVARREEQGFAADIWAVGCTVIEMATGSNPWPELGDPVSALYRIGFSGEVPDIPKWLSANGKDFLSKCLRRDPNERWTATELLQHPFVSEVESHFKDVNEVIMSSPCTVLDHGIWDCIESPQSSTHKGSSLNSPGERFQKLNGSAPNWSCDDEDWITVRSNEIEETDTCSVENNMILGNESSAAATLVFDLISEAELRASIFYEDFFLESSVESNSSSSIVLPCDGTSTDDFVLEHISLENDNKYSFFIQFQSLPMLYFQFHCHCNLFWFNFTHETQLPADFSFSVPAMTLNKVISWVNLWCRL